MRVRLGICLLAILLQTGRDANARDTEYKLRIDEVLQSADYKSKVGNDVAFQFGARKSPLAGKNLGEWVTNRKTNSAGRPDAEACRWAMLSALVELKERARKEGGDAVVNIVSYYKKREFDSDTLYECHAGAFIAGVALRGTVVKRGK